MLTLRRVFRAFGWLFLAVVLLAAAAGWYAYGRFKTERVRALATQQLSAMLHREVLIDRLVLSPKGFKVLGLRVRGGPRAGEEDLLSCDSALATIRLGALFRRRLEFDTVLLQAPRISLLRDAEGDWGLSDVFGSSAAVSRPAALPLALAAAETVVTDGVLRVDDRLRGRTLALTALSLRVDGFDVDRPFPVEFSFNTSDRSSGRTVSAAVSASGRVYLAGLDWSSATARADRLRVEFEGVPLTGRAELSGFSPPRIDAELSAPPLGPEHWRRLLGRDLDLSAPASRWRLKAGLPAPAMVDIERLSVETAAGAASATGVFDFGADTPTLSVELSAREVDLGRLGEWSPALARRRLEGKATLRVAITGALGRLQARESELALRGFAISWEGRRLEGMDIDASASDEFSSLKAAVTKGRAALVGNAFDDISIALAVERQNLSIERLSLRWGDSRVRLRARVERLSAPKEIVLSGVVDKLDLDSAAKLVADFRAAVSTRAAAPDAAEGRPWLRTFKYAIPREFPDTVGHLRVGEVSHASFACKNVDLMWSLRGITPALDKASGEARLRFGPGRVSDIPAVQGSNKFLRVVFLPFVFMHKMNNLSVFSTTTAYPKTLDFSLIDGEYSATKGMAATRYFQVDSPQLAAYAEGTADFGRERVDMSILTRLTSYRGALPEWWVDEAGRPAIGFRVKGDINTPNLEPRFKKIGAGEIEAAVEAGRARARKRFEALERLQTL